MASKFATSFSIILGLISAVACLNGGQPISQPNARFVASVRLRQMDQMKFGSGFLCAATVITNFDVLTTASCVSQRQPSQLQVAFGRVELDNRNVVIDVRRISIHVNYTAANGLLNNIAVLRLSRNIRQRSGSRIRRNTNSHIQPITLDNTPISNFGQCRFLAWGTANNLLMQATLPIIAQCGNTTNGVFCAGNVNNGPALCTRNLGGPLICNNRFSGFAIDDTGCGRPGTNGTFHSIAHHRQWINRVSDATIGQKLSIAMVLLTATIQILF